MIQKVFLALVGLSSTCFAQFYEQADERHGLLTVLTAYESWSAGTGNGISQVSTGINVEYPLTRIMSVSLRGGHVTAGGDVTSLSGLTDTQLGFTYRIESANVMLTLGINAPTGKRSLTPDEFNTDTLVSKDVYAFYIPRYGQGLNVHPAAVWAFPLSDQFVIGVGGGFQYMGAYLPLQDYGDYDPGDEWIVSGGWEFTLSESSRLSSDVIYSRYGRDKFNSLEVYQPGNKLAVSVIYHQYFEYNELSLRVRYRTRSDGSILVSDALVTELNKANPDVVEAGGQFRLRLNNKVALRFLLSVRTFENTGSDLSGLTLIGGGVRPEYAISPEVTIVGIAEYQRGDLMTGESLNGLETGVGLSVRL